MRDGAKPVRLTKWKPWFLRDKGQRLGSCLWYSLVRGDNISKARSAQPLARRNRGKSHCYEFPYPRIHLVPVAGQGPSARGIRHGNSIRISRLTPGNPCHAAATKGTPSMLHFHPFRIFQGFTWFLRDKARMARAIRHGNSIRIPRKFH